ncbi:MAG: type VI secretion system protein TssA [Rhodospirillales bacterium]|nr:type VI secretion system protein TssA [Rhodospirillales bacterium]
MAATIPIDQLLADITADNPCGDDLEYDPEFGALARDARSVPEQVMGDAVVPAREPDWPAIRRRALDLFSRTKDLRVGVLLTRALLNSDGFAGLSDGLTVLVRLVAERWDGVHPRLDPDDNLDPTTRVNVLATLCDKETFLKDLRTAPLFTSRAFGPIRYRDVLVASGILKVAAEEGQAPALDLAQITAASRDADAEAVIAAAEAVRTATAEAAALETNLTAQVGVQHAASFAPLTQELAAIAKYMDERLAALGLGAAVAAGASPSPAPAGDAAGGTAPAAGDRPPAASGEITSREDVVRLLDRICAYYARHEPASPVPILLQRAKRLVPLQFVDIIRDLAPDALAAIDVFRGADTPDETG